MNKDLVCANLWALLPSFLNTLFEGEENIGKTKTTVLPLRHKSDSANFLTTHSIGHDQQGQIAVIPIHGVILPYSSLFAEMIGATCLDVLSEEFCKARDNPDVRAIVLDIDSPGGMVTGVHAFSQQVFAARSTKPIISMVTGMAASAAYWIASAASQLVLDPTASVGSIGVVTTYQDASEKQKKEGIQKIEIVSSQSPYKRPDLLTEEGRGQLQGQVDALADVFVNTVALHRNVSFKTVLSDFGQGGLVIGSAAVKQNMADSISTLTSFTKTNFTF